MKITRTYTFHVEGISIINYTSLNKHTVVTLDYKRTYKIKGSEHRPTYTELWREFDAAIDGHPFITAAWVELLMERELAPNAASVRTNWWRIDIPQAYKFDGVIG
jgi:hypothetical protein